MIMIVRLLGWMNMKRSEMIRQIHARLNGTPIDHDNYADQFLTVVEELGMLPPYYDVYITDPLHLKLVGPGPIKAGGWEPEDETG